MNRKWSHKQTIQPNDTQKGNIYSKYIWPQKDLIKQLEELHGKNMANVVTEYNINQGDFQLIMGLLTNIDSLRKIRTMDMDPKNNTYEDYQ